MARYYGKSSERGYGSEHQKLRRQLLASWRPGDPCARCGQPMYGPPDRIHLGHTEDRTDYIGLEHSNCNCADGARRGNQQRPRTLLSLNARDAVCQGCGKPYHYAARACEMCGLHYHPSYGQQRTCSRACGTELRRRAGNLSQPRPQRRKPRPLCKTCGRPCRALNTMYCSAACAGVARTVATGLPPLDERTPSSPLHHYTCRYCGSPGIAKVSGQPREVCPQRECQLARLAANNLRTRQGITAEEADAQVASRMGAPSSHGKWASARRW